MTRIRTPQISAPCRVSMAVRQLSSVAYLAYPQFLFGSRYMSIKLPKRLNTFRRIGMGRVCKEVCSVLMKTDMPSHKHPFVLVPARRKPKSSAEHRHYSRRPVERVAVGRRCTGYYYPNPPFEPAAEDLRWSTVAQQHQYHPEMRHHHHLSTHWEGQRPQLATGSLQCPSSRSAVRQVDIRDRAACPLRTCTIPGYCT